MRTVLDLPKIRSRFPALASGMSANGFRSVVEIDLLGSFHVLQAVYPQLRRPGASVIQISAPQAALPMIGQAHVCAAKAGVAPAQARAVAAGLAGGGGGDAP